MDNITLVGLLLLGGICALCIVEHVGLLNLSFLPKITRFKEPIDPEPFVDLISETLWETIPKCAWYARTGLDTMKYPQASFNDVSLRFAEWVRGYNRAILSASFYEIDLTPWEISFEQVTASSTGALVMVTLGEHVYSVEVPLEGYGRFCRCLTPFIETLNKDFPTHASVLSNGVSPSL